MKELIRLCGVAVLIGLLQIASAEAIDLSVSPSAQTVDLGDPASVDIVVSNLGGEIVSAFDLDITYDASIIEATNVSFGPLLGDLDPLSFETLIDFDIFRIWGSDRRC